MSRMCNLRIMAYVMRLSNLMIRKRISSFLRITLYLCEKEHVV